jgi:hypothetical protein
MADGFLGRWSRRKLDVREGKSVEDPPPPPPAVGPSPLAPGVPLAAEQGPPGTAEGAAAAAEIPPAPTLADAQALTPDSDFKAFVARDVAPEVRNLAMKKLFADPHFNVMDGLDIYIGDYTQPDPLPEGMLRKMASAHTMGFFDHEKSADDAGLPEVPGSVAAAEAPGQAEAIDPEVSQPRDGTQVMEPPVVAQSEVCNAIPNEPFSELGAVSHPSVDGSPAPASHIDHDDHAHLRLQPDDAPQRESVGRGSA